MSASEYFIFLVNRKKISLFLTQFKDNSTLRV